MVEFLSPEVKVFEKDLTTIVPSVATTDGALAGVFRWGPLDERVLVDNEGVLKDRFGGPTNFNAETWFTGADFLAYSNRLHVVRTANTTSGDANAAVNAIANTSAVNVHTEVIRNEDHYTTKQGTFSSGSLFIARFPGAMGNSLRVAVCDSANAFASTLALSANANANGVLAINVGSTSGLFAIAGTNTTIANTFATSIANSISSNDLLQVGNSTIGTQFLKVKTVGVPATNSTHSFFSVNFADRYRLSSNLSANTVARYWEFYNVLENAPGQSNFVASYGNTAAQDELHVVVVDDGGLFTGTPGSILESYANLSRATDGKNENGLSSYYRGVINQGSQYVWAINDRSGAVSNTALNVTSSSNAGALTLRFAQGQDGLDEANVSLGTLATGYDKFQSAEDTVDVSLVLQGRPRGGTDPTTGAKDFQLANYLFDNIGEIRKDLVIFVSPEKDTVVNNPGDEVTKLVNFASNLRSTSYGFIDTGYKYRYDRYNDVYRWTPLNGDMAGLVARADSTNDAWWSPAGFNRGQIKNVIRLAFNPRKAQRDILYKNRINPIVSFQNEGVLLFGDKTLLNKPSAFDRINVRRLFIVLEKAIARASKYSLFEFNDEFTRAQFRALVTPYLRDVKGRRGIQDFLVVCDDTNNTPAVIDRNEFIGDIYLKPARSVNYIKLNFVAVGTGTSFSEVVGLTG